MPIISQLRNAHLHHHSELKWVVGGVRQWISGKKPAILRSRFQQLQDIPIDKCVNFLAFTFAQHGWHYYTATLREYDRHGKLPLHNTILHQYHRHYQPTTLSTILPPGSTPTFNPPIGIYPWGNDKAKLAPIGGRPLNLHASPGVGPSTDALVEKDYHHLIHLYQWLQYIGYRPWLAADGFITGTILRKTNGDWRFLVNGGNRRCAILSHLGRSTVTAWQSPDYVPCIREEDVNSWHHVRLGHCPRHEALLYFNAYFNNTSHDRMANLHER